MTGTHIVLPVVESFSDIDITSVAVCNEPLDAVKSLPEFTGVQEKYASWRRAALMAYRVFKPPRELPGRPNAEAAQNMSLFTLKTYVLLRPTHLCINSKTK